MLHVLNLIIYKNKIDKCMHVKALILKTCIAEIEKESILIIYSSWGNY